jgi:menaquinone-9 beta-reductase
VIQKEIRIVGGGLAGLTLGLLLRREGVPTQIFDAGSHPRPKVCGEFISGKGVEIVKQLNVVAPERIATAHGVRFFERERSSREIKLPQAAIAVDRANLDQSLALAFQQAGGVLHENVRWTQSFESAGLIRATGRRLSKCAGTMVGIKGHARNIPLSADLELHFSDAGYVGLSRQPGGTVNVCALFTNKTALKSESSPSRDLAEIFSREMGSAFRTRLQNATFDDATFASVAGISLQRERAAATRECRIGDSICMIPPMTGNGMSIALESATLAAPILRDYSQGRVEWEQARHWISRKCDRAFGRRLIVASFLQKTSFRRAGRQFLLLATQILPRSVNGWFWLTR